MLWHVAVTALDVICTYADKLMNYIVRKMVVPFEFELQLVLILHKMYYQFLFDVYNCFVCVTRVRHSFCVGQKVFLYSCIWTREFVQCTPSLREKIL